MDLDYYRAIIDRWPTLGGDPTDQALLAECRAAYAVPEPTEPYPVDGNPELTNANSDAWLAERHAWHRSWARVLWAAPARARMAALNAESLPGPDRDVLAAETASLIAAHGAQLKLRVLAGGQFTGDATHDHAVAAARLLTRAIDERGTVIPAGDAGIAAGMIECLDALVAQDAADAGSTGFTSELRDAIVGLAKTTIPWWKSAGYSSPVSSGDLEAIVVYSGGEIWLT
jgi:hypothetical protein